MREAPHTPAPAPTCDHPRASRGRELPARDRVPPAGGTGALPAGTSSKTTRRTLLAATGAVALLSVLKIAPARATPDAMQAAIRNVIGEAPLRKGKVTIDVPPLVENGNTVPLTISVDSPMTQADHVEAIHLFNQKNPQPDVIGARLSPRAGKAQLSTRIKLAAAQTIVAVAQLSDGTFWSGDADVIVTIAACVEDLQ